MNAMDAVKIEVELWKKSHPDDVYGHLCLDSAMRAYSAMLNDGHSGSSWGVAAYFLGRLLEGKPLTPITEEDFNPALYTDAIRSDKEYLEKRGLTDIIQCYRMSSLFKHVYKDGRITYTDVDRVRCKGIGEDVLFHSGVATRVVDEMYPITLPYDASDTYTVYVREGLYGEGDPKTDFDTVEIDSIQKNDLAPIPVHRYFREKNGIMVEIGYGEYIGRDPKNTL